MEDKLISPKEALIDVQAITGRLKGLRYDYLLTGIFVEQKHRTLSRWNVCAIFSLSAESLDNEVLDSTGC